MYCFRGAKVQLFFDIREVLIASCCVTKKAVNRFGLPLEICSYNIARYIGCEDSMNGIIPMYVIPSSSVHGSALPSNMTILRKESLVWRSENIS